MKTAALLLLLVFSTTSFSQSTTIDDSISEKLAPLLSNYLSDYAVQIQVTHYLKVVNDLQVSKPVLLVPPKTITAGDLQDCEENATSLVCSIAKQINQYIQMNAVKTGKFVMDIKVMKDGTKPVQEFKAVEVYSL